MRIDIISCVPELLTSPFEHSILRRARERKLLQVHVHDLREYGLGKHRQIDDYQYGGGAGMVLMIEPLVNCIESLKRDRDYDEIIYLSPDGQTLDQKLANNLSLLKSIVLICGHYKGIDERVRAHFVTREISIGDYVLSGGELAAAVVVDAVGRLLPGVLNDESSALMDSFQDKLLGYPVYTRPEKFRNWEVPKALLSGHQAKIEEWRHQKSLERTKERRPDLFDQE